MGCEAQTAQEGDQEEGVVALMELVESVGLTLVGAVVLAELAWPLLVVVAGVVGGVVGVLQVGSLVSLQGLVG